MYKSICVWPKGGMIYVVPDLAYVFPFPQILFLHFSQKIALQAMFLILSQLSLSEFDIKSLVNRPAVWFLFAARSLSKMRTMPKMNEQMRSTSSHKFPQYIIYLSTKIKAPSEKYLRSCWGYFIDTITLQTNISIMMRRNRRQFCRNGDRHRGGYG